MFGVSQQISGELAWAYYVIPVGLIVAVLLWMISKAGQNLARAEMDQMRSKFEDLPQPFPLANRNVHRSWSTRDGSGLRG